MINQMRTVVGNLHVDGAIAYRRRIVYKWDDVNSRVIGTYFKTWYYRQNGKWAGNSVGVIEYQTPIFMKDWESHRGMKRRIGNVQFFGHKAIKELTMALC